MLASNLLFGHVEAAWKRSLKELERSVSDVGLAAGRSCAAEADLTRAKQRREDAEHNANELAHLLDFIRRHPHVG